jgi:hypothetical protein
MSRVSSGSIVSDYGLDDRAIGVRSPAGAKDFSYSLFVQTGSRPTQPPVQWVPGVLFPGLKRGRGVTLTTHPHLVPRSSPQASSWDSKKNPFLLHNFLKLRIDLPVTQRKKVDVLKPNANLCMKSLHLTCD